MNKDMQRLFLVGSMGAGKSTIGHLLANQLDLPFFDTDHEIEKRSGADISWIFDKEGEQGFRDREEHVLADLSTQKTFVIATGGGVVLRPQNRELLKARGFVIYLSISVRKQLERTAQDTKRPLLQTNNKKELLEKLYCDRDPLYCEVADLKVAVDRDEPRKLISYILNTIRTS